MPFTLGTDAGQTSDLSIAEVDTSRQPAGASSALLRWWFARVVAAGLGSGLALHLLAEGPSPQRGKTWFDGLSSWDSGFYTLIAQFGYSKSRRTPFYPGYPLVGHLAFTVTGPSQLVMVLLSWGSLAIAALGLRRLLLTLDLDPRMALLAFLWGPASVFLVAGYSESFAFAFATWALVFAMRQQWAPSAALAAVASLSRPEWVLLACALALSARLVHVSMVRCLAIGLAAASGTIAYFGYLWVKFGTPFESLLAEAGNQWLRRVTLPLKPELTSLYDVVTGGPLPPIPVARWNLDLQFLVNDAAVFLAVGAVVVVGWWAREDHRLMPLAAMGALLVLSDFSTGTAYGRVPDAGARLTMTMPVLYVAISRLLPWSWRRLIALVLVPFAIFTQTLFVLGYFFT